MKEVRDLIALHLVRLIVGVQPSDYEPPEQALNLLGHDQAERYRDAADYVLALVLYAARVAREKPEPAPEPEVVH